MGKRPTMTVLETLDLFGVFGAVLLAAVSALVTGVFGRGPEDEKSLYLYVCYAATRKMLSRCSAAQIQFICPPTEAAYENHAKMFQMTPRSVDLPHDVRGFWFGDPNAEHVLIWYHGGGFTMPGPEGHFKFLMNYIKTRPSNKPSLSILFPDYSLSPQAQYPTQLTQAVETLRYLITTTKRSPSKIMIAGDSSGGNLVMGVLSHLKHPHKAIDELTLTGPLAAAMMMGPWLALNDPDPILAGYSGRDSMTELSLVRWSRDYMGSATPDPYTDPSCAPAEWFRGVPVHKMFVMVGSNEYLLPCIDDFVKKLEAGYGPVEYYVADKEVHDAPFVNLLYNCWAPTGQGTKLKDWIEGVIA
ncbi:hypothetical protein E4U23_005292 [Claviceps purpurea]|nr:hypothetical protein E4U23_005292 [Claviceps purpurea]